MKSFYYKGNTYAMTDDRTIQELKEDLKKNPYVALRLFREERCMALHFIEEDMQNVLLCIKDPDRIIESESFVYSREKYEAILKEKVKMKCIGCMRYDGDFENLSGNDIEMTLEGICFQRQEERAYNFKKGVEAFWNRFTEIEKSLRSLIRKGEMKEARDQIKEIFDRHIGAFGEILFGAEKEHSVLMMSGLNNSMVQCVLDYVINRVPKQLRENWLFFSYISKDFYEYHSSGNYDASKRSIKVIRKKKIADHDRFEVVFRAEKDEKQNYDEANIENYNYICSKIGENLLQNIVCDMSFSYDEEFEDEITLEEFYLEILGSFMPNEIQKFSVEPNIYSYKFIPGSESMIRGKEQESFTSCRDLTFKVALYDANKRVDSYLNQLNLICAYLEIILTQDNREDERRINIMFRDILAELEKLGLVKMFSYELSRDRLYLDMLVTDAGSCRKEIRKRSPELERFGCLYTEVYQDRRVTYQVDYDLKEIQIKDSRLN